MELTLIKDGTVKVHEDCATLFAWFKVSEVGEETDEEIKNEVMLEANMYTHYGGPGRRFWHDAYVKINKTRTKVLAPPLRSLSTFAPY